MNVPVLLTDGREIIIKKTGVLNRDSGPDFFDARILIEDTLWVGNVEIHVKGSDWFLHQHHKDKSFDNVVLHVVFENDKQVGDIPTLELKDKIDKKFLERYDNFMLNSLWIPCGNMLPDVDDFVVSSWLESLIISRVEAKTAEIESLLDRNNGDWEETFFTWLMRNFGFKANSLPFELLGQSLPFRSLLRLADNPLAVESMLFGMAGFLTAKEQYGYFSSLQIEFQHLKNKFNLKPLEVHLWKFMRLRPANFPTIRIAQFSGLICERPKLFSQLLEATSLDQLFALFKTSTNSYWDSHYRPNSLSKIIRRKPLGKTAISLLCINTVIPFLFIYGKKTSNNELCERALAFLEEMKPENNAIVREWKTVGISAENALQSQALLQLKKHFCDPKHCTSCRIGISLLSQ